jgi:hypothetical protein
VQTEDHLKRAEDTINAVTGLLPFTTYLWRTASRRYSGSNEPNLVQSSLSLIENVAEGVIIWIRYLFASRLTSSLDLR